MASGKNKYELTRNETCNRIKELFSYSSNIVNYSDNVLKSSNTFNVNKNNYTYTNLNETLYNKYDQYAPNTFSNKNNDNINNNDDIKNIFLNSINYDKVFQKNQIYNTAVGNIKHKMHLNKYDNTLNFIKFEESANLKIPFYVIEEPLNILFPSLNDKNKDDNNKNKSNNETEYGFDNIENQSEKNKSKNEINSNDIIKNTKNMLKKEIPSHVHNNDNNIFYNEERKSLQYYLKGLSTNNNTMRNKMYDYIDCEKKGMIEIDNPNILNNLHTYNNIYNPSYNALKCYKSRYVTNNSAVMEENELNTLNFLKKQKMIMSKEKEEAEINLTDNWVIPKKKINLLEKYNNKKKNSDNTNNKNYKTNNILSSNKNINLSIINISNHKATLKPVSLNNNDNKQTTLKNNNTFKEALQLKKKQKQTKMKNAQVQTQKEEFNELLSKNNSTMDSGVEEVIQIFKKKKKNYAKMENAKTKSAKMENATIETLTSYSDSLKEKKKENKKKTIVSTALVKNGNNSCDKNKRNSNINNSPEIVQNSVNTNSKCTSNINYNIVYKVKKYMDALDISTDNSTDNSTDDSTDDSSKDTGTGSSDPSYLRSAEEKQKNKKFITKKNKHEKNGKNMETTKTVKKNEKNYNMVQHIINYNNCIKMGIPYNVILNKMSGKKNALFFKTPLTSIDKTCNLKTIANTSTPIIKINTTNVRQNSNSVNNSPQTVNHDNKNIKLKKKKEEKNSTASLHVSKSVDEPLITNSKPFIFFPNQLQGKQLQNMQLQGKQLQSMQLQGKQLQSM
ncbi:conserved protein, unknown function, partial [Hepatocystis sp. ex Piliocolobus tephrosceles]